ERTMVIGSPGGSTIITQVLEGILHFIDGENAQQIAAHPRFHHQYLPDVVMVEPGAFDAATSAALEKMGYTLKQREPWGFMNVVTWIAGATGSRPPATRAVRPVWAKSGKVRIWNEDRPPAIRGGMAVAPLRGVRRHGRPVRSRPAWAPREPQAMHAACCRR